MNNAIFLVGFMGSGKSTVGKHLSYVLEMQHADTDVALEKKHGNVQRIFANDGERVFREYESAILRHLSTKDAVISTGGGIAEREENIKWMETKGVIVWLDTSFSAIKSRLKDSESRPLWNENSQQTLQLYKRRKTLYQKCANIRIVTDDKAVYEIVAEIQEKLTNWE